MMLIKPILGSFLASGIFRSARFRGFEPLFVYYDVTFTKGLQVVEGSSVYLGLEMPLYPGSKILRTTSGVRMTFQGEEITCLHTIQLLTTDELKKITAFYKEQQKATGTIAF